jgi:aldehyde:ferredoxin oxidoreductase
MALSASYLPVLEVDLTTGVIRHAEIPDSVREEWVGGTGLGLYLLSQELRPGMKATDPDCPVYMFPGPLTGTAAPSSSDCALTTLNPDIEHHVCTAHAHAFFGSRLRQTGWDGIIIRGRAEAPVYLWIEDGSAELRPAGDLWGADTFDTPRRMRALADGDGADVSVACIGPGGENLVWGSSVRVDEFSGFNTGGPGVVWGSKNLKAIAVRGEGSAPVHDGERLARLVGRMAEEVAASDAVAPPWPFGRRFLKDQPARTGDWGVGGALGLTILPTVGEVGMINGKNFSDTEIGVRFGRRMVEDLKKWKIEPESGWNCDVKCHHRTTCTTGPMAGAKFVGFGSEAMEELGPNLGIEDPGTALMLCAVVDGYGLKAAGPPRIIGMLMEAFNRGEIGLEETGGIDLTWGNYQGVLELLEQTVQRQGLGDLIAQGFKATATTLGIEHLAMHMKWNGFQDYDQRAAPLFLFQSQVVSGADLSSAMDVELAFGTAIKPEAGVHEVLDPEDLSVIPQIAFKSARWTMWENTAGQCHFLTRRLKEATHVEAVSAASGHEYTYEEALLLGERLLVLQRMIQLYLGFTPEEDFVIAKRLASKIPDGPAAGLGFTAEELRHGRDEYYRLAGFSTETGVPSPESLVRLGLDKVVVGSP